VCDICSILNLNQSAVSHQLKILKSSKLVKSRREGKHIYYSLKDNKIENSIKMAVEHIG
jgi:ArsR family transcriptional regulator